MMKYFENLGSSNWCSRIKPLLNSVGLDYVWKAQTITNETGFITEFVKRL